MCTNTFLRIDTNIAQINRYIMAHPMCIFNEIAAAGTLVDSFREISFLYSTFCFADYFPKFRIFWKLVAMGVPRRIPSVPFKQGLTLSVASRAPSRHTDHGSRRPSESAPGTRWLSGTVGEIV